MHLKYFFTDYRDPISASRASWNTNRDRIIQESAILSRELVDSVGDLSKIQHEYGSMQHKQRGRTTSGGSSPLNPHSFSMDDPNVYISDAKAVLAEDQGLSTRNRDYITEVLERLAERVTSAELSRNMVVGELVTLRERFQVMNLIVLSPYAFKQLTAQFLLFL